MSDGFISIKRLKETLKKAISGFFIAAIPGPLGKRIKSLH